MRRQLALVETLISWFSVIDYRLFLSKIPWFPLKLQTTPMYQGHTGKTYFLGCWWNIPRSGAFCAAACCHGFFHAMAFFMAEVLESEEAPSKNPLIFGNICLSCGIAALLMTAPFTQRMLRPLYKQCIETMSLNRLEQSLLWPQSHLRLFL